MTDKWRISSPFLGSQPLDEISTTQQHPLGTIIKATHPTYGEGEFIYLKGVGSTVAGAIVTYDDSFQTALATSAVGSPNPLAIAVGANVADRYGWYQIAGIAYVAKSGSLCLLKGGKIAASSGLAIAISTNNIIAGAIVAINASVVSPARAYVYVMVNRPHGPGAADEG